ncbi:MAG: hypothetical protein HRU13_10710 [Phycisphaerales bacterium]|nr:hypothetical protein [Phycisphaerales bacterium]
MNKPNGVAIPMLVSGIFNLIYAASATFSALVLGIATLGIGCACLIIPVPAIILGIFELKMYNRLSGPGPYAVHKSSAHTIAIIQVISIIFGNVVSFVCGIIALVNMNQLDDAGG